MPLKIPTTFLVSCDRHFFVYTSVQVIYNGRSFLDLKSFEILIRLVFALRPFTQSVELLHAEVLEDVELFQERIKPIHTL